MTTNKTRKWSFLLLAAGLVLMVSAASHARPGYSPKDLLNTLIGQSDGPMVETIFDTCGKKPQWTQVWNNDQGRIVWKENWIENCSETD